MAIKKVYELSVDLKKTTTRVNIPVLVQGDSAEFRIRLLDNGDELSTEQLTGITKVSMQSGYDAQTVIQTVGTLQGSVAVFRLKKNELFRSGTVQAMIQLEDSADRISTLRFQYQVIPDLSSNYIPGEQDLTIFQRYMTDAQQKIDEMAATDVAQLTVKLAEMERETNAKLEQNELEVEHTKVRALDFSRNGILQLPSDFPKKLNFQIYKSYVGLKHNFDSEDFWKGAQEIYVSYVNGTDSTSSGSKATPYKTVKYAVDQAHSRNGVRWVIKLLDKRMDSLAWGLPSNSHHTFNITKNISIKPDESIDNVIVPSANPNSIYTWSSDENVFYTTRSVLEHVYDSKFKDVRGNYLKLQKVNTLTECKQTRNSYYYANNVVYVNRLDGSSPDNDLHLITQIAANFEFAVSGVRFWLENINFAFNSRNNNDYDSVKVTGNANSEFVHKNCLFGGSRLNGLAVDTQGSVCGFNSDAHHNSTDGFNYHDTSGNANGFVFEFECYGSFNGNTGGSTYNATTAHDGMSILRVGSFGHDCRGPILADVNGCYSVNVNCNMYDSTRSNGSTRAAFWFDNAGSNREGKAYMIDCGGGGVGTYTVNTDGLVNVYVKNLKGSQIPDGLVLNQLA